MLRCWTKKMNWFILKSQWHRWQSHHLEEIPKSRANSTDWMKNAKRITFKFFFPCDRVGRGVCLMAILKALVTSCWSSVADTLSRRSSTSACNLPWPLTIKPGCRWLLLHIWAVALAFTVSEARPKEWDVEPQAKLLQDYLCQTGNHPAQTGQHQFLP